MFTPSSQMASAIDKEMGNGNICIHCSMQADCLYKQTNGNLIKLIKCAGCGNVVDRYVECERSIIFMDMVLQEQSAYRHILFNAADFARSFYMKLALALLLSEGYVRWTAYADTVSPNNGIRSNELYFYIMCALVTFEYCIFCLVILLYTKWRASSRVSLPLMHGLLLSQYGRLSNLAAIVWHQTGAMSFQVLLTLFLLVSCTQILRVVCRYQMVESIMLAVVALVTSKTTNSYLQPLALKWL
ncbi:ACAT-related protein required for viability 1 [Oratosquilla oratoria]|uniref:ACAT-related protein required for viability 1 n=1 Tax=Oratosquilla oratoria TaxID=337810 RepID=UPI003F76F7F6